MSPVDAQARIATQGIQQHLPGGVVTLRKINSGQALKVSVALGNRVESDLLTLPTHDEAVVTVVEDLVWRIVPRKSAWDRLMEMDL